MKIGCTIAAGIALVAAGSAWSAEYAVSGQNTAADITSSGMAEISYTPVGSPFTGSWDFAFHDNGTADFSGNLFFGNYSAHTVFDGAFLGEMSGTVSYLDANQMVSGVGEWDAASRTLSYLLPAAGINASGASTYSESGSSCSDTGSILGATICGIWAESTPEWEGLELELVFTEDLGSFTGLLTATERSGTGFSMHSSVLEYAISGSNVSEVPLPAAAWLFGSALLALGTAARRRTA